MPNRQAGDPLQAAPPRQAAMNRPERRKHDVARDDQQDNRSRCESAAAVATVKLGSSNLSDDNRKQYRTDDSRSRTNSADELCSG